MGENCLYGFVHSANTCSVPRMCQQMSSALGMDNEGNTAPAPDNSEYSHTQVEIGPHAISQGTNYQLL